MPFYIYANYPPDSAGQLNALLDAFQEWENVTSAKVSWIYMGMTSDPVVLSDENVGIVSFEGLEGNASAFTSLINGQTYITGFNIRVGNEGAGSQYAVLKIIAMHEIGYALGLSHSTDPNAIMYPVFNFFNPPTTLGADDIAGVSFLYPAGNERPIARLIIFPDTIITTGVVTLDASSSSDDGSIVQYIFHFGDGSPDSVTSNSIVSHNYSYDSTSNPMRIYAWVELMDNLGITDNSGDVPNDIVIWSSQVPSSLVGLTVIKENNKVYLSWQTSPEPDLTYYQVKRSSWSGGPYMPIGNVNVPDTIFTDSVLTCRHYYYVVTAYDTGSNESPTSNEVMVNTSTFFPNALLLTMSSSDALCYGEKNGYSIVKANAGFSPYTYLWSDPYSQIKDTALALYAGLYNVTVTDILGCYNIDTVLIKEPNQILLSDSQNICEGQSYYAGGTYQTTNGIYYDTLTSGSGCDSIIATNLTVNPLDTVTVSAAICEGQSYELPNGTMVSDSGTYITSLTSVNNCDSVIFTNLIVNIPHSVPVILQSGDTLLSSVISGNQWYNDNGIIASASYNYYIPVNDGNYFVIVTENGCASDTSNIISFTISLVTELTEKNMFSIFPNPVRSELTIEPFIDNKTYQIEILNLYGQSIYSAFINHKISIDMSDYVDGIYIIRISADKSYFVKKNIIKLNEK